MAGKFIVEVSLEGFESRAQELAHIDRAVSTAVRQARSAGGVQTAGAVTGDRHAHLANWKYTPGTAK